MVRGLYLHLFLLFLVHDELSKTFLWIFFLFCPTFLMISIGNYDDYVVRMIGMDLKGMIDSEMMYGLMLIHVLLFGDNGEV